MDAFRYDLRLAWRGLIRAPLASALAVGCLALGIGTNATMFGMVSSLLLKPLPFRQAKALVTVQSRQAQGGVTRGGLSSLDLADIQEQSRTLEAIAGVSGRRLTFSDTDEPERVLGAAVALGAEPGDVRRMMIGQGLRLAAWGIGFGVLGAFAVTRLIASLLYHVTPTDPASFALVALRSE